MTNYLALVTPPPPPNEPSTTVWLVNGVLTIADSELATATNVSWQLFIMLSLI